jgi:hypothetical protein
VSTCKRVQGMRYVSACPTARLWVNGLAFAWREGLSMMTPDGLDRGWRAQR